MTTTFERLRALLIRDYHFAPESLTLEAPLEELGIDSLGVADLLFNIEDEFHVSLPSEPVGLLNIGDVVRFIDALVDAQEGDTLPPANLAAAPSPAP